MGAYGRGGPASVCPLLMSGGRGASGKKRALLLCGELEKASNKKTGTGGWRQPAEEHRDNGVVKHGK